MDHRDAIVLAARILAKYPSSRADETVLAGWAEELVDFDLPLAELAAFDHCRRNPDRYAPSIYQIRKAIVDYRERMKPSPLLLEEQATPDQIEKGKQSIRKLMSIVDGGNLP